MPGRVVEIAQEGRSLHLDRGFLAVREGGETLGRVPLDDIDAVLISAQGAQCSTRVMAALAERGAPLVIVGPRFEPVACLVPLVGHHGQGTRAEAQASATLPTRKRLWASVVRTKIGAQAAALARLNRPGVERLRRLAGEVRTGDTSNREALAAQAYWPALMGPAFRRDRQAGSTNAALNYGYAVLRAAAARAIVASGLNPALALHHRSDGDGLRLADDLMEPFRPAVDLTVHALRRAEPFDLDTDMKRHIAAVLQADVVTENGRSPVSVTLVRVCQSLTRVFLGEARDIRWPDSCLPLEPSALDQASAT